MDRSSIDHLLVVTTDRLQLLLFAFQSISDKITSRESFECIDVWLKSLRSFAGPDTKIFLVATKCDLEEQLLVKK